MAASKKSTEVAKKSEAPPPEVYDYGDHAGTGFENTKATDLSIPFINLLQSNSPEVQKSKDGSVRIGMMKNTVTGEIFNGEEGFLCVPVHYDEAWVEWVPRTKGGGFVGLHDPNSDEVTEAIKRNGGRIPKKGADGKKIPLAVGDNELVETYYLYVLLLDEAGESANGFAVIAFTSTKIKPYRDALTSMFTIKGKPPIFANRLKITTDIQENESGTFGNYVIEPMNGGSWMNSLIPPGHALLEDASSFREMVLSGLARANFDQQQDDGAATGDNPNADGDEPF